MKLGHNKRAKMPMPDDQKPSVRKIREWVIGMSFFSVGNILNFTSFGFAAQSLLAALGSIQFVSNVIFAYFVLHEPINRMVILATTCIVGGCVLLVVFGNQSGATYTVKQLTQLYGKPAYVVYLCLMGVGVVGGYMLYLHGSKKVAKNGPRGFWYAILPVSYAVFSALIGTQSVLFSKSMSVILRLTFTGENQLGNWYTWLVLPLFFSTAVFWITRLNKGLRMFPAMIIVPVMQISWTLFSIISGMLYFQEYLGFTPIKSVMFPIGVLVVFVGVFLLTQSGGAAKQASYQKMEEDAAAKAAQQDAAKSAFGSTSPMVELPKREPSVDARSEISSEPSVAVPARVESPEKLGREEQVAPAAAPAAGAEQGVQPLRTGEEAVDVEKGGDGLAAEEIATATPSKKAPALEDAAKVSDSPSSMLDTVKRHFRAVQEKLNRDLLSVEAREGFRQAMGLGEGGMAISLFAMPTMMDYAHEVNPRGHFSGEPTSPIKPDPGLRPILEDTEVRSTSSFSGPSRGVAARGVSRDEEEAQRSAPASPRHASLGRKLIDQAERGVIKGIEAVKRAPSNLQRVVREKQGYGSLYDDEERGLLEAANSLEVAGRDDSK
ncbi:hypothetical protein HXX76_004622 [Chlamydomonas incerta]|uniref:Probable magnesium transporter n=1 Tax=Chlamydomonas incerta TaxID=51695 RepID=A0A835T892_CHLIN|nr:hypothetical protein HXX76_004622 [Chlamydomonas incerta]|eukprot:KAG2439261.1 hypothetical protein HXX76_004622 [Chlamydomonas incerta]